MRRRSSFPWILVGAGSIAFWTLALGVGIPSFARLIGLDGSMSAMSNEPPRCLAAASVEGRDVVFGECTNVVNVRFVPDLPPLALPPYVVPYRGTGAVPTAEPTPDEATSVGLTSY